MAELEPAHKNVYSPIMGSAGNGPLAVAELAYRLPTWVPELFWFLAAFAGAAFFHFARHDKARARLAMATMVAFVPTAIVSSIDLGPLRSFAQGLRCGCYERVAQVRTDAPFSRPDGGAANFGDGGASNIPTSGGNPPTSGGNPLGNDISNPAGNDVSGLRPTKANAAPTAGRPGGGSGTATGTGVGGSTTTASIGSSHRE